jgi:hypothetical protein
VVVVDGTVAGGPEVVVVAGGDVVVVAAAVVVVTGGCVVDVAADRVAGIVVEVGMRAESGRVETFDGFALAGAVVVVDSLGRGMVELVVGGAPACPSVVVVDVAGGNSDAKSLTAWPYTPVGWSSRCTTTNKVATARSVAATQLHCSNRR